MEKFNRRRKNRKRWKIKWK